MHVTEKSVRQLGLLSLEKGRLGLIYGQTFPPAEQVAQRGCARSVLGDFWDPTAENPELPGLIIEVALLGAGGWTGDLLSCHLT